MLFFWTFWSGQKKGKDVSDQNANWSIEEILQNSNHVSQSACTARVNAKPKYGIVREGFAHANIAEKPGLP